MTAQGDCDPRFARVREVFEGNFARGEELGASFAVYLDGEPVVDLWDGVADRHTGRPWVRDTPVLSYSCTKGVTATALHMLAERGLVDVRGPVAEVWPEFAAHGKEKITVEHLLTHQAGLPVIEREVPVEEFEDQAAIADRLAGQAPIWEPGTAHGYHALTYGFLVGEVIRRVTGGSVGEMVAAEIAGPRGLDLWLGAPDDVTARAGQLSASTRTTTSADGTGTGEDGTASDPGAVDAGGDEGGANRALDAVMGGRGPGDPLYEMAKASLDKDSLMNRAMGNPSPGKLKGGANHPVIMRAGWPAMGLVTTARGLAGFYRDLVAGDIVKPETLDDAIRRRVQGPDRVMFVDSSFGLGYMRSGLTFLTPAKGADSAFGHTGLGGSIGLGDVRHGLAMAYNMNKMASAAGSLRAFRLVEATYNSLP
ncbi:serine hydrolase domain-containing protein [Sphaerisporangium corydalis]|uniref:Serine hydrolase domain-containing protein n=1 Tax=Sphaerisporangium corydalis TaxID=1441875 RepID=A0ABV9E7A3_9ACTN|nr:serine hydrolase domain-containing protein [Sphaerisporangium corydalis]